MLSRSALENAVHALMEQEVGVLLDVVPYAGHLISDREEINEAYYLRHRIETVKRIRMTSRTDALALASMVEEDYEAARRWSRYIAAELDHDRLYLRDLRRHGYLPENVAEIEPFPATVAMVHYIEESIRHAGSLAAVAYSVCVEWNSARASAAVVQKAERQFSEAHVLGAKVHVGIDDEEDHYKIMLDIAHRLMQRGDGFASLDRLLRDILGFFADYFRQLHAATVAGTHFIPLCPDAVTSRGSKVGAA